MNKTAEPILDLPSAADWWRWLAANHTNAEAVFLRIPKGRVSGGITYAQALEAALAWGWIDSRKQGLDDEAWLQRFGPRTARSPWSKINRAKAAALIADGRMEAPGLAEVERAQQDGRWERAYDGARSASVPEDLAAALAADPRARAFFEALDSANRFAILYRVQEAKAPKTRAARIERYVAMCARGETIHSARGSKS